MDDIERMDAELAAILVDLEARAKYGKIEGVALPLLDRAKSLTRRLEQRLMSESADTCRQLGPEITRLVGQLKTVELALTVLRDEDVKA